MMGRSYSEHAGGLLPPHNHYFTGRKEESRNLVCTGFFYFIPREALARNCQPTSIQIHPRALESGHRYCKDPYVYHCKNDHDDDQKLQSVYLFYKGADLIAK